MAKHGSTGEAATKKFGSEAGRQRIQERRDRLAEVRAAPRRQVPAESVSTEKRDTEKGGRKSAKRSSNRS